MLHAWFLSCFSHHNLRHRLIGRNSFLAENGDLYVCVKFLVRPPQGLREAVRALNFSFLGKLLYARPYLGRNPLDIAKVPIKDTLVLE